MKRKGPFTYLGEIIDGIIGMFIDVAQSFIWDDSGDDEPDNFEQSDCPWE